MSVRQNNSVADSFGLFKRLGSSVQSRHAAAFCLGWAGSGQIQPNSVDSFSFSFSARFREFIEN
jgi:hypothetical protein